MKDEEYLWRANRRSRLDLWQVYTFLGLVICIAMGVGMVELLRASIDEPLQFTAAQLKAMQDCREHRQVPLVADEQIECRGVRWRTDGR